MMEDCEDSSEGVATQDWDIVAENRKKDGFREGVTVGREAKLQEGFNKGFEDGLKRSLPIGFMCGVLSGILALSQSFGIPDLADAEVHDIEDILQRIQQLKDKNVEKLGLSLESNINATSSTDEGLKSAGNASAIGGTVTGTLESQLDELKGETSQQSDGDFCQSQSGEENKRHKEDNQSASHRILQDYNRLLRDLNLEEILQSWTSVS